MGAFYSQRVKARTLGVLIAGVAGVSLLILLLPHADTLRERDTEIFVPIALAIGLGLVVGAGRVGETALRLGVVAGIATVGVANYVLGPAALVPVMYTWIALYVFAFFRRIEAGGYMVLLGVTFALVVSEQQVTSPVVRWLLGIGTPIVAGLLLSMVVRLAVDLTEVLQESEEQTSALSESAPNAFLTVDARDVVGRWNHEAERLFGYNAA